MNFKMTKIQIEPMVNVIYFIRKTGFYLFYCRVCVALKN